MARQNIGTGTAANDGTGDTLRAAATKINDNFVEIYKKLGGDSDQLSGELSVTADGILFEGSTVDDFETVLKAVDPDSDRVIRLPNANGEVITDSAEQTIINKTILNPILGEPKIHDDDSSHQYTITPGALTSNVEIAIPSLSANDIFVLRTAAQTLENKNLDSATINNPALVGQVADANGAELIHITAAASAVNELTVTNAATGASPEISASGDDTDVNLKLSGQGLGVVELQKVGQTATEISASGAAPVNTSYIIVNSATAIAISLGDGTTLGEQKFFTNKNAGIATITPTNFGPGTSVALDQNDGVTLIWDNANWNIIGGYGETVS